MNDNLDSNKNDLIASALKSSFGLVPYIGSILSELVGSIIPNQRLDRLVNYVRILDQKVSDIPLDKLNKMLKNEEFIDLMEEGFLQATKSLSDERRNYIASIVHCGIENKNINLVESKYLLKILSEINDIEIIWLKYFGLETIDRRGEFSLLHRNILLVHNLHYNFLPKQTLKEELSDSYIEHLVRLRLIYPVMLSRRKYSLEEERYIEQNDIVDYRTSTLGGLLLSQIGL